MALRHLSSTLRHQSFKGYHVSATHWQHKLENNTALPKLSKNFRLLSADEFVSNKAVARFTPETRPLVVMLTWMNARRKRVDQYSSIYLSKGYDVLTVTIDGWQFLFPTRGAQTVAQDLLNYLHQFSIRGNQPLLLHGFSIGAYFWGEVLLKIKADVEKYSELLDRVKGVIWDSTPDFKDTVKGLPFAIAPHNLPLRVMIRSYITFHLLLLYPLATKHYIASSRALHSTPCTAPILMLICRNDPIASVESNLNVKRSWESLGIETSIKIWDESKHVSHYFLHTDDYMAEIERFLKKIKFPTADANPNQIQSKL
uniref:Transmembrane protein 53-B n=1 Tax=Lygus hesperus TaxID=30085 RepID=A0A146M8X1_LYGHE